MRVAMAVDLPPRVGGRALKFTAGVRKVSVNLNFFLKKLRSRIENHLLVADQEITLVR